MFENIPVEVGLVHEGERVRKNDMRIELGGPSVQEKFELVTVKDPDQISDGAVIIIGPDIAAMEEGKNYPVGILVEIAGVRLEKDLEGVIERRIHEYCNFIEGFMHLNQRYDIWLRLSKKSFGKGLDSFKYIGMVLCELYKNELPFIEKIQVTFITDAERIRPLYSDALAVYEARDEHARGLADEDVDTFYGCALCQSFAPTHVCVITPQRYANCGAISWFDGRAAAGIDPDGPIFPILKGTCIDPVMGEYEGVNESAKKRSMGEVNRVCLYTAFGYPHTSCGCFEGIAFFIPEVDGFGIVLRGFHDITINGLAFSTMADSTAGGRQIDGFHGISLEYMRSKKFMSADGGYNRVVWMPHEIKERLRPFIPADILDKIATEQDVRSIPDLKEFLIRHDHPVVERWSKAAESETGVPVPEQYLSSKDLPVKAGGFWIIFKNAIITAEKVIIQPVRSSVRSGGKHNDKKEP